MQPLCFNIGSRRAEDDALMMFVELTLIIVYTMCLVIKSCRLSASVCMSFGFGESADGEALVCPAFVRLSPISVVRQRLLLHNLRHVHKPFFRSRSQTVTIFWQAPFCSSSFGGYR